MSFLPLAAGRQKRGRSLAMSFGLVAGGAEAVDFLTRLAAGE
jgi:hypothetical protein